MLCNIHLLLVIAAFAVVYYHLSSVAGLGLNYSFGIFFVDVFFVICGFIIAYIGSNNPRGFLLRRLIRIWCLCAVVAGSAIVASDSPEQSSVILFAAV